MKPHQSLDDSKLHEFYFIIDFSSYDYLDDFMAVVLKASAIFQALPLGQLLLDMQDIGTQEILKSYYKDFIHMVYPVKSEEECDVSRLNTMTDHL